MKPQSQESFATLFKKYRLKSEIETLSQFGDLLAQEGLVYENSLFTHWQRGDRIPKDRKIILAIILLFARRGGVLNIEEANRLITSTGLKELAEGEEAFLYAIFSKSDNNKSVVSTINFPKITYGRLLHEQLHNIARSRYFYWIAAIYLLVTVWHVRVWIFALYNSYEVMMLGLLYGLIPLSSGFYIYSLGRKNLLRSGNRVSRAIIFFSLGIVGQWVGLNIWLYYNFIGVDLPYPSFADIGYFSLIPFYILGAMELTNGVGFNLKKLLFQNKKLLLLLPVFILVISYSLFLETVGFTLMNQLRMLLGAVYPLGEIIPIMIVMNGLIKRDQNRLQKTNCLLVLSAFFIQFIAEYTFIYTAQINGYVNGGFNDYLYATSYFCMNLTIIFLANSYSPKFISKIRRLKSTDESKSKRSDLTLPRLQIYEI